MKRLIVALCMLTPSAFAAGPYVVADSPDATGTQCVWDGALGPLVSNVFVNAEHGNLEHENRICARDMAAAPLGSNTITLAIRYPTGDSVAVPFTFVLEAAPVAPCKPENLRIVK